MERLHTIQQLILEKIQVLIRGFLMKILQIQIAQVFLLAYMLQMELMRLQLKTKLKLVM